MTTATEPIVDPEIEAMLRALTPEEREQLRESIQREGCREALVVWREEGILLDGHNRKSICEELGFEYRVVKLSFASRHDALVWVIHNQMGRRNLKPGEMRDLIGRRYKLEKRDPAETQFGAEEPRPGQNDQAGETRQRIAAEVGVSASKVQRAEKFVDWVDAIRERVGEVARTAITGATIRLTDADLAELAGREDVTTMEQVTAFAAEKAAARKPKPSTPPEDALPFITRNVNEAITWEDPDTGEVVVTGWKLSCGHEEPAPRGVVWRGPGKHQKTAPCYQCGSGTRTPYERRRKDEAWQAACAATRADDARFAHGCDVWRHAIVLAGLGPMDKRRDTVRALVMAAADGAGLLAVEKEGAA